MLTEYLAKVMERKDLSISEMEEAMELLMDESAQPLQVAAFLAALRAKGETCAEITGAVRLLLRKANLLSVRKPVLMDNCGTGGDCKGTFNISTTAAFVAAGGGVPMAKHGNRSVSSKCGSADVAEALGAEMPSSPERASAFLEETGIVLLFAPHFHPVMRRVAGVRKTLGVRTLFNILGPLLNPAPLTHQVMGVFDSGMGPVLAEVLLALGRRQGMVISGHGGFDELSLSGENRIVLFSEKGIRQEMVTPEDAGLSRRDGRELTGGNASENAQILEEVLSGRPGAFRDVVVLNAAAVFLTAGMASGWKEGAVLAGESIDSGRAAAVLKHVRALSRQTCGEIRKSA